MHLEPIADLNWAYQLHFYLCFRTHRRIALFESDDRAGLLSNALNEICRRHDYHLLRSKIYPDHVRCLVSLRPEQDIAKATQTIKTNSSREICSALGKDAPLWARGYLARSVGRVRIDAVRQYLHRQAEHHGYADRLRPPVFRYRKQSPIALAGAHSTFELNYHVVVATRFRRGVFSSEMGQALVGYWLKVASKRDFAVDQATVLPDHIHLLVRAGAKTSIEKAVLSLLNNGQYFVAKTYPQGLIEAGSDQLWQPSAYAGTTGTVTTALLKAFLAEP